MLWLVLSSRCLQPVGDFIGQVTMRHREQHRTTRIGWLRASVLGANDGIVSTASLVIGVAATHAGWNEILVAGVAGLTAGALSMAGRASTYRSAHKLIRNARTWGRERRELAEDPDAELRELAGIYVSRGLEPDLARTVARQLTARDPLAAHARDEPGHIRRARRTAAAGGASPRRVPLQSGPPFRLSPPASCHCAHLSLMVAVTSLLCLAGLGALAARTGGAPAVTGAARVAFWGAIAMAVTAGVGRLFGAIV